MDLTWLKTLAPTVATALGGPLAGLAVEAVGKALGIDAPTIQTVEAALSQGKLSGDQVLALKQAELAMQSHEADLGFKFSDLEVADRKDARAMQAATHSMVPAMLTLMLGLAFVGSLAALFMLTVPAANKDIVVYVVGQLATLFGAAVAFWIGTTRNSATKTDLLARASPIT